jgi:hypothetical protein
MWEAIQDREGLIQLGGHDVILVEPLWITNFGARDGDVERWSAIVQTTLITRRPDARVLNHELAAAAEALVTLAVSQGVGGVRIDG